MIWLALGAAVSFLILLLWIRRVRQTGITGEKARNKHFQQLAADLDFRFVTDDYFVQLEGARKEMRVILYPHNFEGPGFVTLLYMETTIPAKDRNWVEPQLSLGRALVDWKRRSAFDYEVTGTHLSSQKILEALQALKMKYPYAAVTLPWRFSYSPLLQQSLKSWKNYTVFFAIDVGRHPSTEQIEQALEDAEDLALVTAQSTTFSDTTG